MFVFLSSHVQIPFHKCGRTPIMKRNKCYVSIHTKIFNESENETQKEHFSKTLNYLFFISRKLMFFLYQELRKIPNIKETNTYFFGFSTLF